MRLVDNDIGKFSLNAVVTGIYESDGKTPQEDTYKIEGKIVDLYVGGIGNRASIDTTGMGKGFIVTSPIKEIKIKQTTNNLIIRLTTQNSVYYFRELQLGEA